MRDYRIEALSNRDRIRHHGVLYRPGESQVERPSDAAIRILHEAAKGNALNKDDLRTNSVTITEDGGNGGRAGTQATAPGGRTSAADYQNEIPVLDPADYGLEKFDFGRLRVTMGSLVEKLIMEMKLETDELTTDLTEKRLELEKTALQRSHDAMRDKITKNIRAMQDAAKNKIMMEVFGWIIAVAMLVATIVTAGAALAAMAPTAAAAAAAVTAAEASVAATVEAGVEAGVTAGVTAATEAVTASVEAGVTAGVEAGVTASLEAGVEAAVSSAVQEAVQGVVQQAVQEAVKEAVQEAVKEVVQEVVKEAVKEALKQVAKEGVKEAVKEAVQEAVKEAVQEAVKKAVTEAVKQAVKEAVKQAVQQAVQQTIQDVAKEGVKEGIKESVKESIKESLKQSIKEGIKESLKEGFKESLKAGLKESLKSGLAEISKQAIKDAPDLAFKHSVEFFRSTKGKIKVAANVIGTGMMITNQALETSGEMAKLQKKVAESLKRNGVKNSELAAQLILSLSVMVLSLGLSIYGGSATAQAMNFLGKNLMPALVATQTLFGGAAVTQQGFSIAASYRQGLTEADVSETRAMIQLIQQMLDETQEELQDILEKIQNLLGSMFDIIASALDAQKEIAQQVGQMLA